MGCTSPPPVPLRRRLVGSPLLGFGAPHDGDVRAVRANFAGVFRCVSLRFGVFLCVYVSFHVRIMLFFRAFVCLFRATTAVFNPQTVSLHVVPSLLFSAHSDGLSFFFVLALSLLWWSAAIVWVLWALIECLVFCSSAAVQRSFLGNTVTAWAMRVSVFSFAQDRLWPSPAII